MGDTKKLAHLYDSLPGIFILQDSLIKRASVEGKCLHIYYV